MKQTSIEWLVEQVNSDCLNSTFIRKELIDKAKAMEKQQIEDAYERGYNEYDIYRNGQNYYNETYEKNI